jgi:hypothetical protein
LLCSACLGRYVRIEQKGLTCAEAHQIAIAAVRKMGYTINDSMKPSPGAPGMITAARESGTSKQGMLVQVFCTTLGAEVEAKMEEGGLAQLSFPAEFRRTFEAAAAARLPARAAAESGLDVLLAPERGNVAELGVDLSGVGVLPVSVRITNRTPRAYRLRVKDVVLQTGAGDRVIALQVAGVAAQVSPAAAEGLRRQVLADRDIKAGETVAGFLLFPFKSYARARVVLTEESSGEPEGFAIEF